MSSSELATQVLIQRYLRHRKLVPRLVRDAAVAMVQSRVQAGTLPCLTDRTPSEIGSNKPGSATPTSSLAADAAGDAAAAPRAPACTCPATRT